MTIYFAAARNREHPAIARALSPKMRLSPANDNAGDIYADPALRSALALFAAHGIGATLEACRKARSAAVTGNRQDCRHWLSVCRVFDRRLADNWALRLEIALPA